MPRQGGLHGMLCAEQVVCYDWNVKCEGSRSEWKGGMVNRSDHVGVLTLSLR